jgi:hypothetical protein
MSAPSKKRVSDHVMSAPSKKRVDDHARGAPLFRLALIAALACASQPALSKAAGKKGAYGAIALERESGQFGYVSAAANSRTAKIEALKQCGQPGCEVVVSFSNACGALAHQPARGAKGYFTATGATQQEVQTKVLRLCADKACTVLAWACTK